MIGEQLEGASLRKDRSLFVDRAVFEMKSQFCGNTVAVDKLGHLAGCEDIVVQVPKYEKAVNTAFRMTDRDLFGHQEVSQYHDGAACLEPFEGTMASPAV